MQINFGALVATGITAAAKVGATGIATLTRPAPPPDALTGIAAGSALSQSLTVVQSAPGKRRVHAGSAWTEARDVLFIAATGLTFAPAVGHTCVFGGITGRVTAVFVYAPAGVPIAYDLAVGA